MKTSAGQLHRIEKQDGFGDFLVYRRCWIEAGLKRYFILRDSDGKILEEFRTLGSAITYAQRLCHEEQAEV